LYYEFMTKRGEDIESVRNENESRRGMADPRGRRPLPNYRLQVRLPFGRSVLAPLLHHDPVNINYDDNDGGEIYLPEVEAILPRLQTCRDEADVCRVVHEELCKTFGLAAVGPPDSCAQIAREIWDLCESWSVERGVETQSPAFPALGAELLKSPAREAAASGPVPPGPGTEARPGGWSR
jgi:hypothetical protein